MTATTNDKKGSRYIKVKKKTATKETIEHYQRCKKAILSLCKHGDYRCSLIGDNLCWYKVDWKGRKAKLWLPNGVNYDLLTQKHRTLYWTLQLWAPEIENETRSWTQKPNGKWGIDKLKEGPLGTRKEARLMTLSVDIDRAKDKEVTEPNVKKWLEAALKLFADYFKTIGFQSYALFFSGGGGYVMLHPLVTTIGEDEKHEIVSRWEVVQKCFDMFILGMEKRFFEAYPEAKQWVKGFDRLNYDSKRQFKTPLSVHKKYNYAVIPLDKEDPVIDFEKASLPVSDDVIEETAKCLRFYEGDEGRFGKHIIEVYADKAKEEIETRHPLSQSFDAQPDVEELNISKWCPCARNIFNKTHFDGPGATRSLAFLANWMRYVGVPREKAYQNFIKKATEWGAETSNIFESFFDGDGEPHCYIPTCENFNIEGSGFPHMNFGGLGFCTPDDRCKQIKHPLQYHRERKTKNKVKIGDVELDDLTLVHVVEKLGGIKLVAAASDLVGLCPFPDHNEQIPNFRIYSPGKRTEHYHCYGCGRHGKTTVEFVAQFLDIGLTETRVMLRLVNNEVLRIANKTNFVKKRKPTSGGKSYEWRISIDGAIIEALTTELGSLKWLKTWWLENTQGVLRLSNADFEDLLFLWQQMAIEEVLTTEDEDDYVAEKILNRIRQAESCERIEEIDRDERRKFVDEHADTIFYCGRFINEIAINEKVNLRKIRFLLEDYIKDDPIQKRFGERREQLWQFKLSRILDEDDAQQKLGGDE